MSQRFFSGRVDVHIRGKRLGLDVGHDDGRTGGIDKGHQGQRSPGKVLHRGSAIGANVDVTTPL